MWAHITHIFSAKKVQHICVSLDVNFNESLTNDIVSFEQLGPGVKNRPFRIDLAIDTGARKANVKLDTVYDS